MKSRGTAVKPALIRFGEEVAAILQRRPQTGALFPYLSTVRAGDRATEFKQRCDGLEIKGVALHSYRYAWAERALKCGYPERFDQQALGHNSKAVHHAGSKHAEVTVPSRMMGRRNGNRTRKGCRNRSWCWWISGRRLKLQPGMRARCRVPGRPRQRNRAIPSPAALSLVRSLPRRKCRGIGLDLLRCQEPTLRARQIRDKEIIIRFRVPAAHPQRKVRLVHSDLPKAETDRFRRDSGHFQGPTPFRAQRIPVVGSDWTFLGPFEELARTEALL